MQIQHDKLNLQGFMALIERARFLQQIEQQFRVHPVCALLGPRQCGKTTLAKACADLDHNKPVYRFDLEDPNHLAQLENPKLALEPLEGLIIIDEIQLRPHLFSYLRVLVDEHPQRRYLILGSASRDLIQQSSESLAGRIGYIEVTPLQLQECGQENLRKLWMRGGFPRSYCSETEEDSMLWRKSYVQSFLERDLSLLGFNLSPQHMRRLWITLAHYHGNIVNYSDIARALTLSDMTIRRYIDILQGTFMVRVLKPWFANIQKRQVKSPKIFIRDSGLLHTLLDIDMTQIPMHPKTGASWEGFALEEVIRFYQIDQEDCYFWSTTNLAELDLLFTKNGQKLGFEFKYTDSPKLTPSMKKAMESLELDLLTLIVPGSVDYLLDTNIRVCGLSQL